MFKLISHRENWTINEHVIIMTVSYPQDKNKIKIMSVYKTYRSSLTVMMLYPVGTIKTNLGLVIGGLTTTTDRLCSKFNHHEDINWLNRAQVANTIWSVLFPHKTRPPNDTAAQRQSTCSQESYIFINPS